MVIYKQATSIIQISRKGVDTNGNGSFTRTEKDALKAVDVLVELLDSNNDFVRFNASSKILALVQDYNLQNDLLHELEEIKESQRADIL